MWRSFTKQWTGHCCFRSSWMMLISPVSLIKIERGLSFCVSDIIKSNVLFHNCHETGHRAGDDEVEKLTDEKHQLKQVFQLDSLPPGQTRLTTHIRDGGDVLGTIEIPVSDEMRQAIRLRQEFELRGHELLFDPGTDDADGPIGSVKWKFIVSDHRPLPKKVRLAKIGVVLTFEFRKRERRKVPRPKSKSPLNPSTLTSHLTFSNFQRLNPSKMNPTHVFSLRKMNSQKVGVVSSKSLSTVPQAFTRKAQKTRLAHLSPSNHYSITRPIKSHSHPHQLPKSR